MTELALETQDAVYFFFINTNEDHARITKLVRKDHAGYDCCSSTTVHQAREWYKQLIQRDELVQIGFNI
jgi:hypothetical protein